MPSPVKLRPRPGYRRTLAQAHSHHFSERNSHPPTSPLPRGLAERPVDRPLPRWGTSLSRPHAHTILGGQNKNNESLATAVDQSPMNALRMYHTAPTATASFAKNLLGRHTWKTHCTIFSTTLPQGYFSGETSPMAAGTQHSTEIAKFSREDPLGQNRAYAGYSPQLRFPGHPRPFKRAELFRELGSRL